MTSPRGTGCLTRIRTQSEFCDCHGDGYARRFQFGPELSDALISFLQLFGPQGSGSFGGNYVHELSTGFNHCVA
jgi:hypothetical protein